jgi:hypothetical protein
MNSDMRDDMAFLGVYTEIRQLQRKGKIQTTFYVRRP